MKPYSKILRLGLLAVGMSACGVPMGGGESGTGLAPKTTVGKITGFGSVFVNGVEYFTTEASFTAEGLRTDESALRVGMVITLDGAVDSSGVRGVAKSISYADELEGVVTTLYSATTGTLGVMGQTIHVDKNTVFSANASGIADVAALQLNQVVEISGYSAGTGDIYATRIDVKSPSYNGQEMELKGLIKLLNTSAKQFYIGTTRIDYGSTASPLQFTPDFDLFVKVKTTSYNAATNIAVASDVELINGGKKNPTLNSGETLELEGVVTAPLIAQEFGVNGQKVYIADATAFDAGLIAQLQDPAKLGMEIEVEGSVDNQGRLVVASMEVEQKDDTLIKGVVGAVYPSSGSFMMFGVTVVTDTSTTFSDDSDAQVRGFNVSFINANADPLEITGVYQQGSNGLTKRIFATQVKRTSSVPSAFLIEGPTTNACPAPAGASAEIAGVTIDYSGLTVTVPASCTSANATFNLNNGSYVATSIGFQ